MQSDTSGTHFLSWFWTPLVVVTAAADGWRGGQVAVSVHGASIVPQRPRLSVGLWKGNFTRELVERSGAFAVHLLRDDQDELVFRFGLQSSRTVDKFAGLECGTGATGAPLLPDCLAIFECRVVNQMDAGDHTIFLGAVAASASRGEGLPLWWRDLRARMPADERARWEAKSEADAREAARKMDDIVHRSGPL